MLLLRAHRHGSAAGRPLRRKTRYNVCYCSQEEQESRQRAGGEQVILKLVAETSGKRSRPGYDQVLVKHVSTHSMLRTSTGNGNVKVLVGRVLRAVVGHVRADL